MTTKTGEDQPVSGAALPVTVTTEDGRTHRGLAVRELMTLLAGLGGYANHFAIVEHPGRGEEFYAQTYREDDGTYLVEYRDGGADRHFRTTCGTASGAGALILGWISGAPGWEREVVWECQEFGPPPEPLAAGTRETAIRTARAAIARGYQAYADVCREVTEVFEYGEVGIEAAGGIVGPLWKARVAEQDTWPATTDADRVDAALAALEHDHAVTARMHFACCGTCGHTEIGGLAAPGARGYVFSLYTQVDEAVDDGRLGLCFGAFPGSGATAGDVARDALAVLARHGLTGEVTPAELVIRPVRWQRRLPR